MTPFASTFLFVLAIVALGFVLRAVTRRKPAPPLPLTAEIRPLRCGCNPKSEHPQFGARPIPCADEEADWWFASENEGDCCVWQERFNSRIFAERALAARGWKSARQWVRAASADTRPEGGDATEIAAPFTSGAVPHEDEADAPKKP